MIRLSVLDQSPMPSGGTPAEAIANTLRLAEAADRLGYTRYWVAEHHSHGTFAGSAPEILVGRLAAGTKGIRVGTGGVMLSHYSPFKVAESFRVLEALYPGRIDLGVGRAPGSDRLTALALAPDQSGFQYDNFPQKVAELRAWLTEGLPGDHPFARVRAMPAGESAPEMWVLGSSDYSGALAAHAGLAFSFAHFISGFGGPQVMVYYRENFRPSPQLAAPLGSVGVYAVCAETEEEARFHAASRPLMMLRSRRGEGAGVPPPEEALAYPWTGIERAFADDIESRTVAGDPAQARERLCALAEEFGVEELVVVNTCHSFEARLKTYELLAGAFGLEGRS